MSSRKRPLKREGEKSNSKAKTEENEDTDEDVPQQEKVPQAKRGTKKAPKKAPKKAAANKKKKVEKKEDKEENDTDESENDNENEEQDEDTRTREDDEFEQECERELAEEFVAKFLPDTPAENFKFKEYAESLPAKSKADMQHWAQIISFMRKGAKFLIAPNDNRARYTMGKAMVLGRIIIPMFYNILQTKNEGMHAQVAAKVNSMMVNKVVNFNGMQVMMI